MTRKQALEKYGACAKKHRSPIVGKWQCGKKKGHKGRCHLWRNSVIPFKDSGLQPWDLGLGNAD